MAALRGTFAHAFASAGLSGAETALLHEQSMNTGFGQSCRECYLLTWLDDPKVAVLHGGLAGMERGRVAADDGTHHARHRNLSAQRRITRDHGDERRHAGGFGPA